GVKNLLLREAVKAANCFLLCCHPRKSTFSYPISHKKSSNQMSLPSTFCSYLSLYPPDVFLPSTVLFYQLVVCSASPPMVAFI
ncbi:hypothetical protein ACQP3C_29660, partial [Escherichia coli]